MKKILALAFLVAVALAILSASLVLAEEKRGLSFEYEIQAGSRNVSDFGITYLRDSYLGQKFTASSENGFYGTVSQVYNPQRKFNSGEEAGWFEGYFGKEGKAGAVHYDAYLGYYNYQVGKINDGDVAFVGLELKFPKTWGVTPFVGSEYYYVVRQTDQNGIVWRGGVESELWGVKMKAFVTGHSQVFDSNSAMLASGIVSAEYAFNIYKNVKLIPNINYQQRFEKEERNGGLSQGGFWGGLAAKITF